MTDLLLKIVADVLISQGHYYGSDYQQQVSAQHNAAEICAALAEALNDQAQAVKQGRVL